MVPVILTGGFVLLRVGLVCTEAGPVLPVFTEVCEALLTNVPDLGPAQLDALAADALVRAMGPRAFWLDRAPEADPAVAEPQMASAELIEDGVARIKVSAVGRGLAAAIAGEFDRLIRTTNVFGLVLDLRFAGGTDYSSLGEVAGLFVAQARDVLVAGTNRIVSAPATAKITVPVAVLINGGTRGAAEALAGIMPSLTTAILIGSRSAGECYVWRELVLSTGRRLCVAGDMVSVPGGRVLSGGVLPDIHVAVSDTDERAYWVDPYRNPAGDAASARDDAHTRTRTRLNEAELERAREGNNHGSSRTNVIAPAPGPARVIRDPVLARAVDVLEAYRLLRASARTER